MPPSAKFDFDERPLSAIPFVVLDTETTGLFPGVGHRVVEIALIRYEGWQEVGRLNQLLDPERHMEPKATAVSGIDDADLVGQPTFATIADQLLELLDGALLVAHNASFDADFLAYELYIMGHPLAAEPQQPILPNPWLCTLKMARTHFYFGRNNLSHIAGRLGVRMRQAHRALSDVFMTAEVLKRMVRELDKNQRLVTVGDLLHAQGGAVYATARPDPSLPDLLRGALAEQQALNILYLGKDGETRRTIDPLYVGVHRGHSYLIAHCRLREGLRPFRVDRIFSAEPL